MKGTTNIPNHIKYDQIFMKVDIRIKVSFKNFTIHLTVEAFLSTGYKEFL